MTAGDDLTGFTRIQRLTTRDERFEIIGERPYGTLGNSSPADQVFVNGGAPNGGGIPIDSARQILMPGERLVWQQKVTTAKTEDSDHANNVIRIPITVLDTNTGQTYPRTLTHADRNTGKLADDPALLTTQFVDAMHWAVGANERWFMGPGELHIRGATTA